MWTMILADDEPIIIHGLQKIVNWEQLGIRVVGTGVDGVSALALILKHQPDLAILDINMPGKTGLEIVEGVRAAHLDTKVIFISGYRQFDYALGAVRLGAVNFLLKPINRKELLDSVRSCLPIPEPTPTVDITDLPIISPSYESLSSYVPVIYTVLNERSHSTVEQRLIRFSVSNEIESWRQKIGVDVAAYDTVDPPCLLFKDLCPEKVQQMLQMLTEQIRKVTSNQIGFLVGPQVADVTAVPQAVGSVRSLADWFYFFDWMHCRVSVWNHLPQDDQMVHESIQQMQEQLLEDAIALQSKTFREDYRRYCDLVCCGSTGNAQAAQMRLLALCHTVLHILADYGEMGGVGNAEKYHLVEKVADSAGFTDAVAQVEQFLIGVLIEAQKQFCGSEKTEALRAIRYIDEHYEEKLTLDTIANYVHMNASYFSSYFKKQTGRNFKEYLTMVRLQNALRLLLTTDKKNYEIAEAVGFGDAKILTQQFQKAYGKTPQAYRRDQKNENSV